MISLEWYNKFNDINVELEHFRFYSARRMAISLKGECFDSKLDFVQDNFLPTIVTVCDLFDADYYFAAYTVIDYILQFIVDYNEKEKDYDPCSDE